MDFDAIKFAYNDYKRRKKIFNPEKSYKPFLKISGLIIFIIIIVWMIHDFIKFSH